MEINGFVLSLFHFWYHYELMSLNNVVQSIAIILINAQLVLSLAGRGLVKMFWVFLLGSW